MAIDPVPRANHARYLVVLALGAFALPLTARILEAMGAPRTPAGVHSLLLAAALITAILMDRPRSGSDVPARAETAAPRHGRSDGMHEAEEPNAGL